jgi:hypothetical protein
MITLAPPVLGDLPGVTYRRAKFLRFGRRGYQVLWVVIHSAECAETDGAAEALQSYALQVPDKSPASWNYAVDDNSTTQSVLEKDTAFHAPPLNDASIGVEQAGRAAQLASDWADPYSSAMISDQLVPLVTGICKRHQIPARAVPDDVLFQSWTTAKQLQARRADDEEWLGLRSLAGGILFHEQVSRVFNVASHHVDPGKFFPHEAFISAVAAGVEAGNTEPPGVA